MTVLEVLAIEAGIMTRTRGKKSGYDRSVPLQLSRPPAQSVVGVHLALSAGNRAWCISKFLVCSSRLAE